MALDWSDSIVIADLADEPSFSDELTTLTRSLEEREDNIDVVLDFSEVSYVNSSNIAQLLNLRKAVTERGSHMTLAAVQDAVWSVMSLTGLEKVFSFAPDKATAIAALQLSDDA